VWRGSYRSVQFSFASPRTSCVRDITDFGNRCELGTIDTPKWNSKVLKKQKCGTHEVRPNGFRLNFPQNPQENPPKMNPNSARKRAEFFRRGGGAKSEAILTHSICFDTKRIFAYFLSYYFCTHYQLINKNI